MPSSNSFENEHEDHDEERPLLLGFHDISVNAGDQGDGSCCCENDPVCGDHDGDGDRESQQDTVSLTCDDSMNSSLSSPSTDTIEDTTTGVSEDHEIYNSCSRSPDTLRRRLLPLAPSPILPDGEDECDHDNPSDEEASTCSRKGHDEHTRFLLRKRPNLRMLWLSLSLLSFVFIFSSDVNKWIDTRDLGLFGRTEARKWDRFFRRKAPKILRKIKSKAASATPAAIARDYTVRIRGKRLDLILQSLEYHSHCPSVREVQVDWRDTNSPVPDSISNHKSGKVTSKGKPATAAVFLLDEDVLLTCDEIERAFHEWQVDPTRLVGFYPFHHGSLQLASNLLRSGSRPFRLKKIPTRGGGTYSMVSDQAVFVHKHYLQYIPQTPPNQCPRLALSIVVSTMTNQPPVAVMSNPHTVRLAPQKETSSLNLDDASCQEMVEALGVKSLPEQTAAFVGQREHR